jgi:2',3'-cyclic-nucleotide 2'-phosphodiesterase/3'-nucleotidase
MPGMIKVLKNIFVVLLTLTLFSCSGNEQRHNITIVATTDVHGVIFGKDPSNGEQRESSMSKISSFLSRQQDRNILLLDNGDNIQGTPEVYYYNFEDTESKHLWPRVLNYIGYDAVTAGNHDIEAGHEVYDRIRDEYNFPMLAANAISTETGEPYFEPYTIIRKGGLKIAVLGLITPGVPGWLPEVLYEGIEFGDMTEAAARWMPEILENEPDLVVGLFHAGWNESYGGGEPGSFKNENASLSVARRVDGFDIIFIGHDHDLMADYIETESGDSVLIVDGGSHARFLPLVDIELIDSGQGRTILLTRHLIKTDTLETDQAFDKEFSKDFSLIERYINREIAYLRNPISTRESFFGDSDFMDLIHSVQLETTGADLSFAAPLSFDVSIDSGQLYVADMFDLYRYENMLYTIKLKGSEIDDYLEYSAALWFNTIDGKDSRILKYRDDSTNFLLNRSYNFDSAEGINYTVDLSKTEGNRVEISAFTNGMTFCNDSVYTVAVNSYRGSGGGGHLTRGCSISEKDLSGRLLESTSKDLRYYMMKWIESNDTIEIRNNNNWRLEPKKLLGERMQKEYSYLFNK